MKKNRPFLLLLAAGLSLLAACSGDPAKGKEEGPALFSLLAPEQTGIDFRNELTEGLNTNVMVYEYFYNGGGVAAGDLNGDGLEDLYFTANMADNKLYLNRGKLQFEEITASSNAGGRAGPWKTGVTMADVNGDNKLDIYLCYSGKLRGEKRKNELFINEGADAQGIPRFSEQAEAYGLADSSYSTHSVFFDYDLDSDLDMLLLNHSIARRNNLDEVTVAKLINETDGVSGLKLFRNDNGRFGDITAETGIRSTVLSHGLGAAVSDINGDGWPDLYISNDYLDPDYLYINNRNGTFTDSLKEAVGHTSFFSMGNNVSDVNNDGLPDILTLDMLPEDNRRQKLLFAPDNYEKIEVNIRSGFHHQFMSNMLHLNNGDGTFSEIGQLSGIAGTDWSWAPLIADYDNDGWKDLYVTNGYLRDYTNMDFLKYMGDQMQNRQMMREDLLNIVQHMPSSNVTNYMYRSNGDLTYSNVGKKWGMTEASNSNGAVYSDLDNDGDLDLVINNINQPAFVYRNEAAEKTGHRYLKVKLQGSGGNTGGTGARVFLYSKGKQQCLEQMPSRGYQSSVSPVLHFGLGNEQGVDSVRVVWPGGKEQLLRNVPGNSLLTLSQKDAHNTYTNPARALPLFREVPPAINYRHPSYVINDFKRQPLLINPLSFSGPCLVTGDVNGDSVPDLYAGGGSGQPGALYLGGKSGGFTVTSQPAFAADKDREDGAAVFFDANGDGFNDLYVASGGYHRYEPDDPALQDRLYLNDGKGVFRKAEDALPEMKSSKSCVRVSDLNGDGYPDLFVGGRVIPGRYPEAPRSYLLINDGKGRFTDRTAALAPALQQPGMITDAAWVDLNGDRKNDLVVVGEWVPVTVFLNRNGRLEDATKNYFDKSYSGFWNRLVTGDFNGDGRIDIIAGNMGLNTQCKVSDAQPAELFYKDFDENGSVDPILCFYNNDTSYPYVTRDELLDQMSIMRTRFTDYKSYADARVPDIFTEEELEGAGHLKANYLKTAYFESGTDGRLKEKALPLQAQFAPVYTITVLDYDKDGASDVLLCGNINNARLRFGKYDASYGTLLKGDGQGNFRYISQQESGLKLTGDVRSVVQWNNTLLFGINQRPIKAYTIR